ncbi:MAG: acetyl-CoA carboxylase biotin carboxyl carrier protein [Candidatus Rokubacteria bacterium]|nr:acetyl-CoA carboxylase biotin carboxyl carrier protein [Candidatus Rokubacteria bacterium]
MDFSYEDVREILRIIDGSSLEELHLEIGEFRLTVRRKGAGASSAASPAPEARRAAPPEVEVSGTEVSVWPEGGPEPVVVQAAKEPAVPASAAARPLRQRGHEVKAPMVGTFYRASAPGAPPFVEVGSSVGEDDTVCIIEVMKLMHSIKAGCRGRVAEICAENGALVEFGQSLMVIEPLP